MKKAFVISSTLLGLVFLVGCGQQVVNQPRSIVPVPTIESTTPITKTEPDSIDESQTWQTYDSIPGISFEYPKNWRCSAMKSNKEIFGANCGPSNFAEKFVVLTTIFAENTTVEQWLRSPKRSTTKKYGDTIVGGKNSVWEIYTDQGGQAAYELSMDFNGKGLSLTFPGIQDKEDLGDVENKILSSFKFIK